VPRCAVGVVVSTRVGDTVQLRPQANTCGIWHGGHRVGVTTLASGAPPSDGSGGVADGQVAAVFRFTPRDQWLPRMVKADPTYPRWHYVPLVQGLGWLRRRLVTGSLSSVHPVCELVRRSRPLHAWRCRSAGERSEPERSEPERRPRQAFRREGRRGRGASPHGGPASLNSSQFRA
jgi:hypothetical protein